MIKFMQTRIINTLKYSLAGLKAAWNLEQAFKLEVIGGLCGIYIAICSTTNKLEKIFLISSILFILIIELINTGLEKTIDKISKEHHPISKIVKDLGSAAVFLALINAALTWIIIFYYHD